MKKIIILILALCMMSAFALSASAEETDTVTDATESSEGYNSTQESESPTDAEFLSDSEGERTPITDSIKSYFTGNLEEISVLVSLVFMAIWSKIRDGKLGSSLGTLNSNSIKIAKTSAEITEAAAEKMQAVSDKLNNFEKRFESIENMYKSALSAIEKIAGENNNVSATLERLGSVIQVLIMAVKEDADEVANLLCLSNIPNSKKDEMYGSHINAVRAIEAMEEGLNNDGEKA